MNSNNKLNYTTQEIQELLDWISYNHLLFGDELNEAFNEKFNELLEKVYEKAPEILVYNTEDEMKTKLAELAKEDCKIGDVVFIVDNNVPDYWIVDVADEQNQEGYYGYFKVSPLEAKTNLNEYYDKEDVDKLIKAAIESRIWDVLNTTDKTVAGAINELGSTKIDTNIVESNYVNNTTFEEYKSTTSNSIKEINEKIGSDITSVESEINSIKTTNKTQDESIRTLEQNLNGTNEIANSAISLLNSLGEQVETIEDQVNNLENNKADKTTITNDYLSKEEFSEYKTGFSDSLSDLQKDVDEVEIQVIALGNSTANYVTKNQLNNYYTKNETYSKGEVDNKITEAITGGTISLDNYYNKQEVDNKLTPLFTEGFVRIEENFSPALMEGVDKCEVYVRDMSYFASDDPYAEGTRIGRYNDTTNSIIIKKDTRILEFEGVDEGSFSYTSVNGDVYKYELPMAFADMVIIPNEYSDYAFFVRLDDTTTAYDKDYIDKYYYRKNEVVTRQTFVDFYEKVVAPAFENVVSKDDLEKAAEDLFGYFEDNYYNQGQIDDKLELKQDALIDTVNIKTINGQSILGEGNLTISSGGETDLSGYYTKQEVDGMIYTTNQYIGNVSSEMDLASSNAQIAISKAESLEATLENDYYDKEEVKDAIAIETKYERAVESINVVSGNQVFYVDARDLTSEGYKATIGFYKNQDIQIFYEDDMVRIGGEDLQTTINEDGVYEFILGSYASSGSYIEPIHEDVAHLLIKRDLNTNSTVLDIRSYTTGDTISSELWQTWINAGAVLWEDNDGVVGVYTYEPHEEAFEHATAKYIDRLYADQGALDWESVSLIDSYPQLGSSNAVSSEGVKNAINYSQSGWLNAKKWDVEWDQDTPELNPCGTFVDINIINTITNPDLEYIKIENFDYYNHTQWYQEGFANGDVLRFTLNTLISNRQDYNDLSKYFKIRIDGVLRPVNVESFAYIEATGQEPYEIKTGFAAYDHGYTNWKAIKENRVQTLPVDVILQVHGTYATLKFCSPITLRFED